MLIGIDASRATSSQPTGTERYSLKLIRHLLAIDTPHRYRLYFNQRPPLDLFPPSDDLETRNMPWPRLWTHARLSWEMAAHPPDVLFVPAHVLPILHPRRSVVTVHDLGYLYFPGAHRRLDRIYLDLSTRFNAQFAAHVLADSQATRRDLIACYGTPEDRISVVYPGRDEAFSPVTSRDQLAEARARYRLPMHYILCLGTLQPRKNLARLFEAFALLARRNLGSELVGLKLVVVGKQGWLYQGFMRQIERLGLQEDVIFTGYVPRADLPAILSGASVFVFPSLYEGFGFPVVEAMVCGTPVVCSNTASIPEVAGNAALLVDPTDVEAMAQAISCILCDEELRATLRERGFAQARKFSWQRCARETLCILECVGQN